MHCWPNEMMYGRVTGSEQSWWSWNDSTRISLLLFFTFYHSIVPGCQSTRKLNWMDFGEGLINRINFKTLILEALETQILYFETFQNRLKRYEVFPKHINMSWISLSFDRFSHLRDFSSQQLLLVSKSAVNPSIKIRPRRRVHDRPSQHSTSWPNYPQYASIRLNKYQSFTLIFSKYYREAHSNLLNHIYLHVFLWTIFGIVFTH